MPQSQESGKLSILFGPSFYRSVTGGAGLTRKDYVYTEIP
jgi:hypothetical protein